jgi:hypothetical protein
MFNGAILAITSEISVYRFEANVRFFLFKMHKPFIWCLTINNFAKFIDILNHLNLFRGPTSVSINRICTCAANTLHVELVLCSVTGCVCFVVPNVNWWGKKSIELVGDESRSSVDTGSLRQGVDSSLRIAWTWGGSAGTASCDPSKGDSKQES